MPVPLGTGLGRLWWVPPGFLGDRASGESLPPALPIWAQLSLLRLVALPPGASVSLCCRLHAPQ